MKPKILFILKQNLNTGAYYNSKSGLWNSARFVKDALQDYLGYESKIVTVIDGNGIDKEVHQYKPTHVVLEAIWCPPYKLVELSKLHKHVKWIIRIHSKTPFLANEGIALTWIKEYSSIENVIISFNNEETNQEFNDLGVKSVYLPNIYYPIEKHIHYNNEIDHKFKDIYKKTDGCIINIGCFGAIRPLKNQLEQAIAAIKYAEEIGYTLLFHINSQRLEQRGEEILKNLRAIFKNTQHTLVEWSWLDHPDFIYLIKQMDLGLQVSLTESFNIVTADFVHSQVPIVVSKDIDWIPFIFRANPLEANDIVSKIKTAMFIPKATTWLNKIALKNYNSNSITQWFKYFK